MGRADVATLLRTRTTRRTAGSRRESSVATVAARDPLKVRVLGLDLAVNLVGWAVLDPGPKVVTAGTFKLPHERRVRETRWGLVLRRYDAMFESVLRLVNEYTPLAVGYEIPHHARPAMIARSKASQTFHAARGLGLAEGLLAGVYDRMARLSTPLPPAENWLAVTTNAAKRAATGNVNADKSAVKRFLAMRVSVDPSWDDNAVDAISVALAVQEARFDLEQAT